MQCTDNEGLIAIGLNLGLYLLCIMQRVLAPSMQAGYVHEGNITPLIKSLRA